MGCSLGSTEAAKDQIRNVEDKFTLESPMPPGWLMYPHYFCSLAWNMGEGEHYLTQHQQWLTATLSEEEQKTYNEMFPRPWCFRGIYKDRDIDWSTELKLKIPELVNRHKSGEKLEYIFFSEPNLGTVDKSCLGQCHPSKFFVDVNQYCCAEQCMQARKAEFFNDHKVWKLILASTDPEEMKALGQIRNFEQRTWDGASYTCILYANYFKFSQNGDMLDFLLSTEDKVLVNADPSDTEMGIGLSEADERSLDPTKWRGQNLLGFALMDVRDDLRRVYQNYSKIDWSKLREYETNWGPNVQLRHNSLGATSNSCLSAARVST